MILIILLMIIIILVYFLNKIDKNVGNDNVVTDDYINEELEGKEIQVMINYELSNKITKSEYYNLKECVRQYQQAISDILNNKNESNQKKLLSMISKEYTDEKEFINFFIGYKEIEIYVDKILMTKLSNSVNAYLLIGKVRDTQKDDIVRYNMIIEIDFKNYTFEVFPNEYIKEKEMENLEAGDKIELSPKEKINNQEYNTIKDQTNRYNTVAIPYFEKLKIDLLYDSEYIFNILDEEYKQKKFNNDYNSFIRYIEQKRNSFEDMIIEKYARYDYDGYIQYVCIDNNENYYIFNENSVMNYEVLLDTYTIDQPEFIEKYEKATMEQKAGYNINKFVEAINDKDYIYAYNCLAESFKQNNFKTLNDFENYIKNNFSNNNELEYLKTYQEGQYYVYETNIINKNNSSIIGQKNFIVNLKEERTFELSFNI